MLSFEQHRLFAEVLKADSRVSQHLSAETIDPLLDPVQYTGLSAVLVDRVCAQASEQRSP
jgi:adenylosuccinate lyase